jgi:hypothetical protein
MSINFEKTVRLAVMYPNGRPNGRNSTITNIPEEKKKKKINTAQGCTGYP